MFLSIGNVSIKTHNDKKHRNRVRTVCPVSSLSLIPVSFVKLSDKDLRNYICDEFKMSS